MTTSTSTGRKTGSVRLAGFLVFHVLLIGSGLLWAKTTYERLDATFELPELRVEPLSVVPRYNDPAIVTDEQLSCVLYKLRPKLRGPHPRINNIDHALRFWGLEATFDDPECYSGMEMLDILLDHRQFTEAWGDKARPFLMRSKYGIRPRVRGGEASASHDDHTLAGLAEVGVPLDYPVLAPTGETTVGVVLQDALQRFSLNQLEYEWSALAFALYLPTDQEWLTTEGQRISFDRIARRIMRQKLVQGVCYGNHRLHALVMMLRVDEQQPILSAPARAEIVAHLQAIIVKLQANQHADGYWDPNWDGSPRELAAGESARVAQRQLATGHVLEWCALAPEEVLPQDRQMLHRAGQWLVRSVGELSDRETTKSYPFLTHVGRALALWRGKWPHEVDIHP